MVGLLDPRSSTARGDEGGGAEAALLAEEEPGLAALPPRVARAEGALRPDGAGRLGGLGGAPGGVDERYRFEHVCLLLPVISSLVVTESRCPLNFVLMETSDHVAALRLDGGHPALDFVNTLGGGLELGPQPHDEHLRSYDDLLSWSVRVGTLEEAAAERLAGMAEEHPARAARVLRDAIDLRELADSVVRPIADGSVPPAAALEELRERDRESLSHARLEPGEAAYRWRWEDDDDLRRPLWPLAHATIELLTDGPLDLVKPCHACRWLFLDRSKNHSRRWCSMEECGTSAKKRRYIERRRALTES
jgi:predicted RNA-binding Zn ribbon-like protein